MSKTPESKFSDWLDGTAVPSRYVDAPLHTSSKTRRSRSDLSSSIASAEISLEDFAESNEFAFLASVRAQRLHEFIYYNNESSKESRERLDTISDFANNLNTDQTMNLAAWEVIDREMTEWQKVCGSGRPSWWSPGGKQNRIRATYVSHTEDPLMCDEEIKSQIIFRKDSRPVYRRARALSDSFLPDTTRLHDLAYLIAIQLLSACFTLPPEHIPETAPSSYHYYTPRFEQLPDPELISVLRMHSHFRFTPSFGHNARNNSMANNLWAHFRDGRCTPAAIASLPAKSIKSSTQKSRRRVRRILNTTEASDTEKESPLWMHDGSGDLGEIPMSATNTAWSRRKGVKDENGQELKLDPQEQKRISISMPPSSDLTTKSYNSPNKSIYTHRHGSRDSGNQFKTGHDTKSNEANGQRTLKQQAGGNDSKSLESQIRSEPHPVFVQPVKELVVKRWRTFRNRFGQAGPAPNPNSTSNDYIVGNYRSVSSSPDHSQYVGNLRLTSPPGEIFTPGSTVSTSSDGKERRRQARKASQINSGSSNETTRFNTPISENGGMSDGLVAAMDVDRASPTIHLLDPLSSTPSTINSNRSSSFALTSPVYPKDTNGRSRSMSSYSPGGGPSAPSGKRRNRKSMLSEMHTPDMYDIPAIELTGISARPPLSIAGSTIASPNPSTPNVQYDDGDSATKLTTPEIEQICIPFDEATPCPESTNFSESPFAETPGSVFVDWSAGNVREQAVKKVMENELAMERDKVLEESQAAKRNVEGRVRPSLIRMSTSGTQCFTPKEDGFEVDGIPVGPGLDEAGWNVEENKGKMRVKRESSFL